MTEERGSGRCGKCHGEGVVPLGVVAGVVPCPECKGKKTCSECLGVGTVPLSRAGEIFGLEEPPTRRATPQAFERAADTDRSPPPDPRREPDDDD